MKSWKTTLAGILAVLTVIIGEWAQLVDNDPNTVMSYDVIIAQIIIAVGLFKARDSGVTSEEEGLK